ncbi:flavin reductase family protein [Aquisalibacillus elongatus]|uniref:Flavin reductase (DIM6/NTAB) family NADH-FMN oxidoreductase RutF n=1 Tax=Aquisalibacillus elongatus TaxID=485577 RepID=A0A3N5B7B6_9BACI|nr:flavin reductase family protein [Aquisalibacillus elongatus]RPF53334.1 flavin reductase (DIM6/NTAB) family NADH-FMN oxidoreductase RutF [Aquisalibacillus elongatus]
MLDVLDRKIMHCYPGMVAIVTVSHNGSDNVMSAGWHSYISYDPPIYGVAIGRERHTYSLVKNAGYFAIHFLPLEKAQFIQEAGTYTGADLNKFEQGNMEFEYGTASGAPILKDAYVVYECKTIDINTYGDHDWFVGDIIQFHCDQEKFLQNGLPDFENLSIPLYLGRSMYTSVEHNSKFISHRIREK